MPQFLLRGKKVISSHDLHTGPSSMGSEQICAPAVSVFHAGFLVKPVHTQRQSLSSCSCAPVIALSDLAVVWGLLPVPVECSLMLLWLALAGADMEHDHRTVLPHVGKPKLQGSHWLDLRWICPTCVKTKKCTTSICLMLTHEMRNSCSL